MKPNISIIVPVYNVEKYLDKCVQSIRMQTKSEWEVVLVDDGSTDTSGYLCDEWAKKDSRILVVHKENGGLTDAWKTGVLASHGEYIGFVDSDDFIDDNMFERLYEEALRTDADVTVCGLVFNFEDGISKDRKENSRFSRLIYNRDEIIHDLFPKLINDGSFFGRTLQAARVTKLFKRDVVINNLKFCNEKVSVGEDLQLTLSAFCDAQVIAVLPDFHPYHYWINKDSITGKHDSEYIHKIIRLKKQILQISMDKKIYDFSVQIHSDFISLVVLAIKNEICKNKEDFPKNIIKNIRNICNQDEVRESLQRYSMPNLKMTERVFLYLIKFKLYRLCYIGVKLFLS